MQCLRIGLCIFMTWANLACGNYRNNNSLPVAAVSRDNSSSAATETSLNWFIHKYGLVSNALLHKLISRVAGRLEQGTKIVKSQQHSKCQQNVPWRILTINEASINAFSIGSHVILLTRGMIHHTQSEAELAAVIAHEMSHELLCHTHHDGAKNSPRGPNYSFSLEKELEADSLSIHVLKAANYDIRHALAPLSIFYRQKNRIVSSNNNDWLSKRTKNMHNLIKDTDEFLPATRTTREYLEMKYYLAEN